MQNLANAECGTLNVERVTSGRHLSRRTVKNTALVDDVRNLAVARARFASSR